MQVTEILLLNTPVSLFIRKNEKLNQNNRVIVSTSNGLEIGLVKGNVDLPNPELVEFVRLATREDHLKNCENCQFSRSLLPEIKKEAEKLGLDMKIGFISTNLDKNKIVVNYTADGRVDFRELLKVLGAKYKSRIEMHQIGNRDETKMIGAIGMCGRETCCKLFLSDFDKVSIKMAKNQNIALNPTKINGMCGRLLCCLKYEDDFYAQMQKKMPKINTSITTKDGKGTVKAIDVLKETVSVEFKKDAETNEIKIYDLAELDLGQKKKNEKNR